MRVDKLTLAALEATLDRARRRRSPRRSAARPDDLLPRARSDRRRCSATCAEAVPSEAAVGGGGAPGVVLPSAAVALPPALADPLRPATLPVVGHVAGGRLLLDLLDGAAGARRRRSSTPYAGPTGA